MITIKDQYEVDEIFKEYVCIHDFYSDDFSILKGTKLTVQFHNPLMNLMLIEFDNGNVSLEIKYSVHLLNHLVELPVLEEALVSSKFQALRKQSTKEYYLKDYFNNLGSYSIIDPSAIQIAEEDWAPGIWVGTNNMDLGFYLNNIRCYFAKIKSVDIQNRVIYFTTPIMRILIGSNYGINYGIRFETNGEHSIVNSFINELEDPSNDCDHSWKPYVGLTEVYTYCEKCDAKQ